MIKDENGSSRDLAIVEKYEAVVSYLYPIFQAFPKRHGALRDNMIGMLMETVSLLYQAAKSKQASRLYAADAHLATLRFWLRFAASPAVRILSHHQHQVALRRLAEVGAMLGQWVKAAKRDGR
ncbi:diversity-generating retroelement protein Avd [Rhizobium sp. CG5]|uniref:diversity-generating retroelement protein Avd n=1 Tax=Rhizobium sp. CG5 TaxID=2726076 RepID=UPI0020336DA2|nr:diversity-generating retroelement protein Avd [Rhizobium sp. CG5]MCM2472120.1 diversity-generating retroelement protein Avd [Rhizobium sp. CG5]